MKHPETDLRRAILYTVSGGLLTAAFGVLGAGAAHAAPIPITDGPSAKAPAKPAKQTEAQRLKAEADEHASVGGKQTVPNNAQKAKEAVAQGNAKRAAVQKPKVNAQNASTIKSTANDEQKRRDKAEADKNVQVGGIQHVPDNAKKVKAAVAESAERKRKEKADADDNVRVGGIQRVPNNAQRAKEAVAKGKRVAKAEADEHASVGGKATVNNANKVKQAVAQGRKKAEHDHPTGGSIGVCLGGHLQGTGGGGGLDSCLVFDKRGAGFANSAHFGAGIGFGAQGTLSFKGSTANIDELTGRSYYGTGSIAAGPGLEASGSVTEDGKHINDSLAIGVGIEAAGSTGIDYTSAYRLFDWQDVLPQPKVTVMAPGERATQGPPS